MWWLERKLLPTTWQEGDRRKFYWIVTRGGIAVGVVLSYYYVFGPRFFRLQERILATSIVASAVLTLILIAVYRDVGHVQAEQAKIMSKQEELLQIEYESAVHVDSWEVVENQLEFILTNLGDGVATNILVGIEIHPQNVDHSEEFHVEMVPLFQDIELTRKNYLSGNETKKFLCEAVGTTQIHANQPWEFTSLVRSMMTENEVEEIEFIVHFGFSDLLGDSTQESILSGVVELKEGMTFQNAIEECSLTNTAGRQISPDNILNMVDVRGLGGFRTGQFFDPRRR